MLTQLHIKNIAVIQQATVSLAAGLNVFTGETGAGKTILISAIDAVLGERTSKDIIRTGEEKALVTALFEDVSPAAIKTLEELGYSDDEGSVLISREIHQNGKSNCKINGLPATVSILRAVSSLLIHIHGQRDSGQLLAPEQHIRLIDTYGSMDALLEEYREAYQAMRETQDSLQALKIDDAQKEQRIDMLTFQIEEIEVAKLEDPDEEALLQTQRKLIKNSAQVRDALLASYQALRGEEDIPGLDSLIDTLSLHLAQASEFIADLQPTAQRAQEIGYELAEFAQDIRNTLDDFDFDPHELDEIEARLDTIYKLKRKYGESVEEVLRYYQAVSEELSNISSSEQRAAELTALLEKQKSTATKLAERMSEKRKQAAEAFLLEVESELAFLDMPSVKLSVQHTITELTPNGADTIELYIVTNIGELPKPLSKIASGGEISRIMLAVKNVLAEKDEVSTLIFDEVDTGVSGRAAQKIGQKLGQVSRARQIICVTHLPQVAAFSDHHLHICKEVEGQRTYTKIIPLNEEEVVQELARIVSGDMVTPVALQSAAELRTQSKALL